MTKQATWLLCLLGILATAQPTYAASCADGKTADNITPQSDPDTWSPVVSGSPPVSTYAAAQGIWSDYPGNVLEILGSTEACLVGGGYDGTLTLALDIDTYYERGSEHGCVPSSCASNQCFVNGVCRNSYFYHNSNAGLAPNNSAGTTYEDVQISNEGDGISLEEESGDVIIRRAWLKIIHDDAVETDWCKDQTVTVFDTLIDNAYMMFAWDVRSDELPCSDRGLTFTIDSVIGNLFRFAHAYEEDGSHEGDLGHGGIFKDDGTGANAELASFTNNVFLVGPISGENQVIFPDPDWITGPCENVVYLWKGTTAAFTAMLGEADNAANLSALSECITVVVKEATETADEFQNRDLAELDGYSYNDVRGMWINGHFGSQPGCGVGPELALLLPLLGALRRRARGRRN